MYRGNSSGALNHNVVPHVAWTCAIMESPPLTAARLEQANNQWLNKASNQHVWLLKLWLNQVTFESACELLFSYTQHYIYLPLSLASWCVLDDDGIPARLSGTFKEQLVGKRFANRATFQVNVYQYIIFVGPSHSIEFWTLYNNIMGGNKQL